MVFDLEVGPVGGLFASDIMLAANPFNILDAPVAVRIDSHLLKAFGVPSEFDDHQPPPPTATPPPFFSRSM
ncbi:MULTISPECIES: hypothetical protein [unclassified Rhizobium]|uniref:hypothetical protein n=1 Tax=unclassified Rhizobium TaxID=2613769 RepID=UPI001ADA1663|nr:MULTISPECIES: hypothetical protein [unclassified Rhizobium]MBO9135139.1 hypothetical protein [Rhizobium sp. B209b/85]